jgi:non-heme Fe2+,alpha-ketoglutarate-dependent halogenase
VRSSQAEQFLEDGYVFPLRALSSKQAGDYRARFLDFDRSARAHSFEDLHNDVYLFKPHLLLAWVDELIHEPSVLDIAEAILGPNLLCWSAGIFQKQPLSPSYVSWHQDAVYYGLSPADHVVRVWVALSATTTANGTMEYARSAHKLGLCRHIPLDDTENLLSLGEVVNIDVDQYERLAVVLEPGEAAVHHLHMPHGSGPNETEEHRINLVITYISPDVRPDTGDDSALLVRGADTHGHFAAETRLDSEFSPAAFSEHARAMDTRRQVFANAEPKFNTK